MSTSSVCSNVSAAGPDLPVRFSQCSIASNRDSLHDPWSGRSDDSGPLSPLGDAAAQTTLTSPMFRQRADKDRSFTASAPPGVRPPSNRQTPGAGWTRDGADDDDDAENGMDRANKISRIEPRRDALSTPVHPFVRQWAAATHLTLSLELFMAGAKGRPHASSSAAREGPWASRRHTFLPASLDAQARDVYSLRVCTVDEAPGVRSPTLTPRTSVCPAYMPGPAPAPGLHHTLARLRKATCQL